MNKFRALFIFASLKFSLASAAPFVLPEKFQMTPSFYAALLAKFTDLEFEITP